MFLSSKMAEDAALRGRLLDAEFVEEREEGCECPICSHILLDPQLLSCCGHHFCDACVKRLHHDRRPCALCNEPKFTALLDKGKQRLILQRKVYCLNKQNGCQWQGELGLLAGHLSEGDPPRRVPLCQYEFVPCSNEGCDEKVLRVNMEQHLNSECQYRRLVCQYCNDLEATYKELSEAHWNECPDFPIPCPNKCGVPDLRRSEVEAHCDRDCKAQVVKCRFWQVGCKIKRPRKDLPAHLKAADEYHSQLMLEKTVELEARVVEQDGVIESLTEELEKKSAEIEEKVNIDARLKERDEAIQRLGEKAEKQAAEFAKSLEEKDGEIVALAAKFDEKLEDNVAKLSERFEAKLQAEVDKLANELAQVTTTIVTTQSDLGKLHKLEREIGAVKEDFSKHKEETEAVVNNSVSAAVEGLTPRVNALEEVVVAKEIILQEAGKEASKTTTALKKDLMGEVGALEKRVGDLLEERLAQTGKNLTAQQAAGEKEKHGALRKELMEAVTGRKKETDTLKKRVNDIEASLKKQAEGKISKAEMKREVAKLQQELRDGIKVVEDDIKYVESSVTPIPPYSFTVSRFSRRRDKKESFVSFPFYTGRRGYKMVVRVDAAGTDTHVSVWCCITRGEHDEKLQWPLRADIHIRLVNQKDKAKHYERQISYDNQALAKHAGMVVTGDKNYLWGLREFITVKEVTGGNFLVGDALDFVVMEVELKEQD